MFGIRDAFQDVLPLAFWDSVADDKDEAVRLHALHESAQQMSDMESNLEGMW